MSTYLDFEKPIAQIAQRATDYRAAGDDAGARHAEGAARRLLAEGDVLRHFAFFTPRFELGVKPGPQPLGQAAPGKPERE